MALVAAERLSPRMSPMARYHNPPTRVAISTETLTNAITPPTLRSDLAEPHAMIRTQNC